MSSTAGSLSTKKDGCTTTPQTYWMRMKERSTRTEKDLFIRSTEPGASTSADIAWLSMVYVATRDVPVMKPRKTATCSAERYARTL